MNCCIVKRNPSPMSFLPIVLILLITVALSVLSAQVSMYLPTFIMVLGITLAVYKVPSILKTEYEYNLEGDTFSVALVKNNSSRKELFSCDMAHLVSCVPQRECKMTPHAKVVKADTASDNTYCAIFTEEEKTVAVIFSPDEEFMKSMRLAAPLKVKLI